MTDVTMTEIWCAQAWLGGAGLSAEVLIEIDNAGIVMAITPGVKPSAHAHRLTGWVLPGFVNNHSHAFHRGIRGRTHSGSASFWEWREQMYALATALTPETYAALARATYAEMVESGYTRVSEFHYLHHDRGGVSYADPNEMSHALAQAAVHSGIGLTLLDTLYLGSAPGVGAEGVQMRFSDGNVDRWIERNAAPLKHDSVCRGLAVHSVRAVTPTDIESASFIAQQRNVPLHAHVSEQPRENEECFAAYGRSPTQVFADAGALDADFTAVHATHLSSVDIQLLSSSHVCLCPTTEAELADGIGPAGLLRDAGSGLSLGSDSQAIIDPFAEMQRIEWDQRLATGRRGTFSGPDLARIGTRDGITVGSPADLVEIDPHSRRLAGASAESLSGLVFAASGADIKTVYVTGVEKVRDGRHVDIDVTAELSAALATVWGDLS